MHQCSRRLALAALCLHLLFNSTSCTVDICSPLICRSDSHTSPSSDDPTSLSTDEPSGSGAATLQYVLDVEELQNKITVTLRIAGSWNYTTAGPFGYMLDVFEEGDEETRIGEFLQPHHRSTAEACGESKNTIMFKSCDQTVLDLPRNYSWIATADVNATICFRATIQNSEDQSCQTLVECRSLNMSPVPTEPPKETKPTLVVTNVTPSPEHVDKCLKKFHCTDAKLKDFCCSDGNTYASRCHFKRVECTYSIDLDCNKGVCKDVPIIKQREPFCEDLRVHLWTEYQWNVFCDCYGQFKPIQCYEDICWCSDEQGYQIGKEVTFEGSDTLNLSCF